MSRTDLPDEEGTETGAGVLEARRAICVAPISPMRRGLKRHLPKRSSPTVLTVAPISPMRRGLKQRNRARGWGRVGRRRTDLPDEEGTETASRRNRRAWSPDRQRRTDLPDEEGTETRNCLVEWDNRGCVAPISPMRRGLKPMISGGWVIGSRLGRTDLPDEEGTETEDRHTTGGARARRRTDLPDEEGTETHELHFTLRVILLVSHRSPR